MTTGAADHAGKKLATRDTETQSGIDSTTRRDAARSAVNGFLGTSRQNADAVRSQEPFMAAWWACDAGPTPVESIDV